MSDPGEHRDTRQPPKRPNIGAQIPAAAAKTLARAVRRTGRRLPIVGPSLEEAVGGRLVLVTGASSGIGRATAIRVARAGAEVVLVSRGREALEEVNAEITEAGGVAHVHLCDLGDEADIDRFADEVLAAHGAVDVLVNNAGRSIRRSIGLSYDRMHDFRRTMELNYFGAVKLVLRFLPGMRERGSGHIVNVSTMGVQTNPPRFSAYIASKEALNAFSRCIASEVVDDGVHMSTVYMPLVRTPMIEASKHYRRFPARSPEEAAELITRAIVGRHKQVSTALGRISELTYATVPAFQDAVVSAAYHLFPDSSAARTGDAGPDATTAGATRGRAPRPDAATGPGAPKQPVDTSDEPLTAEQRAFERVTRGVHW